MCTDVHKHTLKMLGHRRGAMHDWTFRDTLCIKTGAGHDGTNLSSQLPGRLRWEDSQGSLVRLCLRIFFFKTPEVLRSGRVLAECERDLGSIPNTGGRKR